MTIRLFLTLFILDYDLLKSHQEIWDDSALIEAWDAAVKQYEVHKARN